MFEGIARKESCKYLFLFLRKVSRKHTRTTNYNTDVILVCLHVRSSSRDILGDETTAASGGASFKQGGVYARSDGGWSPVQRCLTHNKIYSFFFLNEMFNSYDMVLFLPFSALVTLAPPLQRATPSWSLIGWTRTVRIQPCSGRGESCRRPPRYRNIHKRLKSAGSFSFNTRFLHFFSLLSSLWSQSHRLFVFCPSSWLRTHTSAWSPTRCPQNDAEPAPRDQRPRCWRRRTQRGWSRCPWRWKPRRWLQRRRRWATWRRRPLVLSGRQTLHLKRKVSVAIKKEAPRWSSQWEEWTGTFQRSRKSFIVPV